MSPADTNRQMLLPRRAGPWSAPRRAPASQASTKVEPYIPASKSLPELTVGVVILGSLLSMVLAGANAYGTVGLGEGTLRLEVLGGDLRLKDLGLPLDGSAATATLNGKRVEGAARTTLEGKPVKNMASLANPACLEEYRALDRSRAA